MKSLAKFADNFCFGSRGSQVQILLPRPLLTHRNHTQNRVSKKLEICGPARSFSQFSTLNFFPLLGKLGNAVLCPHPRVGRGRYQLTWPWNHEDVGSLLPSRLATGGRSDARPSSQGSPPWRQFDLHPSPFAGESSEQPGCRLSKTGNTASELVEDTVSGETALAQWRVEGALSRSGLRRS